MSTVILMSFFQVACQYENMRIYVTDDDNDNNNDDVDVDVDGDVDNNSQVNLHSPLTVHVSSKAVTLLRGFIEFSDSPQFYSLISLHIIFCHGREITIMR